jgi:hypothetical protein
MDPVEKLERPFPFSPEKVRLSDVIPGRSQKGD